MTTGGVGADPVVVVAGEALIDLVPVPRSDLEVLDGAPGSAPVLRPVPAGSPVNVAVGLGRLGVRCSYLGALSGDGFGEALRARLEGADVGLELVVPTRHPTTLAVVHLDEDGRAEYGFYVDGTSAATFGASATSDAAALAASPDVVAPAALPDATALHVSFGAIGPTHEPSGRALAELVRREAGRRVVSLDPNVRPNAIDELAATLDGYEQAVAASDVVKVSDEDLQLLYPNEEPGAVADRWARSGPAWVVVTRGPAGAFAVGPAGRLEVPGLEVAVADTVGAGDAFTAGLLASLTAGRLLDRAALRNADEGPILRALEHAVRVAAVTCTRNGADPPSAADLDVGLDVGLDAGG